MCSSRWKLLRTVTIQKKSLSTFGGNATIKRERTDEFHFIILARDLSTTCLNLKLRSKDIVCQGIIRHTPAGGRKVPSIIIWKRHYSKQQLSINLLFVCQRDKCDSYIRPPHLRQQQNRNIFYERSCNSHFAEVCRKRNDITAMIHRNAKTTLHELDLSINVANFTEPSAEIDLWHQIMAHTNFKTLKVPWETQKVFPS